MIAGSPADSQALNRYNYCCGNPIGLADPNGHGEADDLAKMLRKLVEQANEQFKRDELEAEKIRLTEVIENLRVAIASIQQAIKGSQFGSLYNALAREQGKLVEAESQLEGVVQQLAQLAEEVGPPPP